MTHPIRCSCGKLEGTLTRTHKENRGICYCTDCQAFARYLRRAEQILDRSGGTDIIQTTPNNVTFTNGIEHLACMRLTPNGLLRWYASCCNTPIGNTLANYKLSFVGLVHNCLESAPLSLDEAFGAIRMQVKTRSALGEPKPEPFGLPRAVWSIAGMLLKVRLDGGYKRTPFFIPGSSTPIVTPKVLSPQAREELMQPL
jgi:hypothetical protein